MAGGRHRRSDLHARRQSPILPSRPKTSRIATEADRALKAAAVWSAQQCVERTLNFVSNPERLSIVVRAALRREVEAIAAGTERRPRDFRARLPFDLQQRC